MTPPAEAARPAPPTTPPPLALSFFASLTQTTPDRCDGTWAELRDRLLRHQERRGKGGPLFSPAVFREGTGRENAHVEAVALAVLDIDDGHPFETVRAGLERRGLAFVAYTTHSHQQDKYNAKGKVIAGPKERYRVAVPFSRPVSASEWEDLFPAIAALLADGHTDPKANDPSRVYYFPTCEPGAPRWAESGDGAPLDPDALLSEYRESRPAEKTRAAPGRPQPDRAAPPPDALSMAELERFDPYATARGAERRFNCPFPACADKSRTKAHQSLAVNAETGAYVCHRCGAKGKLFDFWEDRPPLSRRARSRAHLTKAFGLSETPAEGPTARPDPARLDPLKRRLKAIKPLSGSDAEAYLASRGIPPELARRAKVKAAPEWAHWRADGDRLERIGTDSRAVFPLYDRARNLVAINARAASETFFEPKQQTLGEKKRGLFATPGALEADPLVITEAPIDALSLAACGVPAVALCGTDPPDWLRELAAFRRVFLATDNDRAGDDGARKIAAALSLGSSCRRLRPQGKDWNEDLLAFGAEALAPALRAALGLPAPPAEETERAAEGPTGEETTEAEAALEAERAPVIERPDAAALLASLRAQGFSVSLSDDLRLLIAPAPGEERRAPSLSDPERRALEERFLLELRLDCYPSDPEELLAFLADQCGVAFLWSGAEDGFLTLPPKGFFPPGELAALLQRHREPLKSHFRAEAKRAEELLEARRHNSNASKCYDIGEGRNGEGEDTPR